MKPFNCVQKNELRLLFKNVIDKMHLEIIISIYVLIGFGIK